MQLSTSIIINRHMKKTHLIYLFLLLSVHLFAINPPTLYSPSNGAINQNIALTLDWASMSGINDFTYQFDVSPDFDSASLLEANTDGNLSLAHVNDLLFDTTYYWRVRANSSVEVSDWSETWSFTTLVAPTLSLPSNGAIDQNIALTLDWAPMSSIPNFTYQFDISSNFDSASLLEANTDGNESLAHVNDLLFDTTYYWRVRANTAVDVSDWSETWSFTTLVAPTLSLPSNGAIDQNIALTLDWAPMSSIPNFTYQFDTSPNFDSASLLEVDTDGNESLAHVNDLLFDTTYYWRVRANTAVDVSEWSETWSFTTLVAPTLSLPSNGAIDQNIALTLDWATMYSITDFTYQFDISPDFDSAFLEEANTDGNISLAHPSDLLYGTTYYWRVRANSTLDTSDWSAIWSFTTVYELTTAPQLISPTDGTTDVTFASVVLEWASIPEATSYQYQYCLEETFTNGITSGVVSSLTKTITDLNQDTTYYWRVRGQNTGGSSPWSAVYSFTTNNNIGVNDIEANANFLLYPNPTSRSITIKSVSGILFVEIFNVNAQVVAHIKYENSLVVQCDLSLYENGIYWIKIITEKGVFYKKVSKK